ncbi:unnamed protein product, partial [Cuscuta epithymum]
MIPFELLDSHPKTGVEEARTSFPASNPRLIHFDDLYSLTRGGVVSIEKEDHSADSCRGRKHYRPGESGLEEEGRSSKQSAAHKEEDDLSEVFDKVLLCTDDNDDSPSGAAKQQQIRRSVRKSRSNKRGDGCEIVDLQSLLIICAKSIADAQYRDAEEHLKLIRQYSSPTGSANQRLAHAFADGLEARLTGTSPQFYSSSSFRNKISISELQKSYLSSSMPFMRIVIFFANKMIYEVASRGASLHIIDFGILLGIQWPTLIRDLSQRPG